MHLQPHGGEMHAPRQKNSTRHLSSPKGKVTKPVETRRDAGKAYGMLASQRNRLAVEKRAKKETVNSKPSNTAQEKSTSPKVKLKSPTADSSKERLISAESTTRVQAWLCENSMLSVKFGPTAEEKATQMTHNSIQSPATGTADLDCHTYSSEKTVSSENTSQCQKDTLAASKTTPAYDLTSSCTIEETEREKQEELEVLARIQELKETKNALLAERRVILLKIEEVKLRQEVRALQRDVCKSRDELNILSALDERDTESITDTKYLIQANTEDCTLKLDTQAALTRESSMNQECVTDTDDGVADVIRKAEDTRSVHYQPSVASPRNNAEVAESSFKGKDTDHPYCNTTTKEASRNEEAVGVTGSNLSEIKEHISRISGLRSAPVMPSTASREEIPGSFTKASSYDGIEMLPEYDVEAEDVSSKALDDAISRLAGGRLDVENEEDDKESSSEGDVISRSDDDDDDEEYSTNLLDSIPLSPASLDNENDRDIILRPESDDVRPERAVHNSTVVSLPIAPFPSEPQKQQTDVAVPEFCPSVVFWSPRNGRGSPRSPRRSATELNGMRNQLSPDMEASVGDVSQHQRQPSIVPDALVTASSCSSCWVQFSQTDRDYVQDLVAKFVRAFCDPHPPDYLNAEDLPIPLEVFATIEKESGGSLVQEAFDRAIFDAVNQRLSEMYQCLGRLKSKGASVNGGFVWSVPCYSSLLEGVQRSVFSTTDCEADPLAPCTSKEQVIEQMLIQSSHRLRKKQRAALRQAPLLPVL